MLDVQRSDLVGAVVGSGTMGRGIVQVLAQCGVRTLVFDAKPGAAQAAKESRCLESSSFRRSFSRESRR